jgi:hypothetical protein
MTKPKAKQPLESFDPRMIPLLLKGARERVVIPFLGKGGKSLAHSFQRRLHTLRARMRHENHEHAKTVTKCTTRLFWGERAVAFDLIKSNFDAWMSDTTGNKYGAFLVLEPTDSKFDSILSQIDLGVEAPKLEELSETQEADLENFLETLSPKGEVEK